MPVSLSVMADGNEIPTSAPSLAPAPTPSAMVEAREVIDRITYLASLVSAPTAVDEMLDTLRRITALTGPDGTIDGRYLTELLGLEERLKDYLITKDPVRSFTKESLDLELSKQSNAASGTTKHPLASMLPIGLSAVVLYAVAIVAVPGTVTTGKRFLLAAPILVAFLNGCIAWLFWSARKNFTAEIRKAYSFFCIGTFLSALASMQFPLLFAIPAMSDLPLFRYVGFMTPFIGACFAFYYGLRLYARQLQIHTLFSSLAATTAIVAAVGAVFVIAPHPAAVPEEAFFDLSVASVTISGLFSLAAFVLAQKITRQVTARYAQGMRTLGLSQLMQAIACFILTGLLFATGPTSALEVGIGTVPFSMPAILLFLAAYSFKKYAAGQGVTKKSPTPVSQPAQ